MAVCAPFNFARIPRAVWYPPWGDLVTHDAPFADGYSGTIEIELQAATELLVGGERREATTQQAGEVWPLRVDDGRFAIPPSTLQGLVRSRLEIACFGKLGPHVDRRRFGIRDLTPAAKPYFQNRMLETTGHDPLVVMPKVRAGWLRRIGATFEFRPCRLARIQFDNLPVPPDWDRRSDRLKNRYANLHLRGNFDIECGDPAPVHRHRHGRLHVHYHEAFLQGRAPRDRPTATWEGSIVVTGNAPGKHMEFVFYDDGAPVTLPPQFSDRFGEFESIHAPDDGRPPNGSWKFYRDEGYGNHAFRKGGWMPIFWLGEDQPGGPPTIRSFGLAFMFKLAHEHDTHRMLEHSSPEHVARYDGNRDSDTGRLDLASLIFGAIGGKPGDFFRHSLRRRATFGWAYSTGGSRRPVAANGVTVMLGPKPSYFPIYVRQIARSGHQLKQSEPYATYTSAGRMRNSLAHSINDSDGDAATRWFPELSGVKLNPAAGSSRFSNPPPPPRPRHATQENRNTHVQLNAVPPGTQFGVTLHVHNLRRIEIEALLWALTLGDEAAFTSGEDFPSEHRHRLGMGKSLGLGEMKLAVRNVALSPSTRDAPGIDLAEGGDCVKAFPASMDESLAQTGWEFDWSGEGPRPEFRWLDTIQVRALIAAARPEAGRSLGHMELGQGAPAAEGTYLGEKQRSRFIDPLARSGWEVRRQVAIEAIEDAPAGRDTPAAARHGREGGLPRDVRRPPLPASSARIIGFEIEDQVVDRAGLAATVIEIDPRKAPRSVQIRYHHNPIFCPWVEPADLQVVE